MARPTSWQNQQPLIVNKEKPTARGMPTASKGNPGLVDYMFI